MPAQGGAFTPDVDAMVTTLGEMAAEVVRVPGDEVPPELRQAERAIQQASERVALLVTGGTGDDLTVLREAVEALAAAARSVDQLRQAIRSRREEP
jgi:hypothetical protein